MNFISLAVSVFISNYIFMMIIKILPFRNKRLWQGILISVSNLGSIIFYLTTSLLNFEIITFLYSLGNILGILLAYVASMMIVFDGIILFKSKRLKEFERNLKNKDNHSISKKVLGIVFFALSILLIIFGTLSLLNYDPKLKVTIIGTFIGAIISISLALFFLIKKDNSHVRGAKFMFIITLPEKKLVFCEEINKENSEAFLLGKINDAYILDDYGILITHENKYMVKGIKVNSISNDYINSINMNTCNYEGYENALLEFQKYNRKKIIVNENKEIVKIINIK